MASTMSSQRLREKFPQGLLKWLTAVLIYSYLSCSQLFLPSVASDLADNDCCMYPPENFKITIRPKNGCGSCNPTNRIFHVKIADSTFLLQKFDMVF
jgi:hypothetical protein